MNYSSLCIKMSSRLGGLWSRFNFQLNLILLFNSDWVCPVNLGSFKVGFKNLSIRILDSLYKIWIIQNEWRKSPSFKVKAKNYPTVAQFLVVWFRSIGYVSKVSAPFHIRRYPIKGFHQRPGHLFYITFVPYWNLSASDDTWGSWWPRFFLSTASFSLSLQLHTFHGVYHRRNRGEYNLSCFKS